MLAVWSPFPGPGGLSLRHPGEPKHDLRHAIRIGHLALLNAAERRRANADLFGHRAILDVMFLLISREGEAKVRHAAKYAEPVHGLQ